MPCKTTEGSELRILLGDADKVVEVVGGWDVEIARGWEFLTPRGRYRVHVLSTAWPLKVRGEGYIGSICDGVNMVIGVMARCIWEIAQGVCFGWQN